METALLFIAGFFGGALNSIAGGGSFITFPALIAAGVPAISANATNTFASMPGYMAGAWVLRHNIIKARKKLPLTVIIAFIGGIIGAWLLLRTPPTRFVEIIPWLLLFATMLFITGSKINQWIGHHTKHHRHASIIGTLFLSGLLLIICIYGGFFNAGFGIIGLSYLALAGMSDIRTMAGLKLVISSCVSSIAVVYFIMESAIAWQPGLAVLAGTVSGGAISAHIARHLPQTIVRNFVIIASICITSWFFYDVYWRR
ncbi:MAG: sulfite exporter TauE/SafE family protein [bacterium]|nr:sulfite exporter TauE/SafE family protein [bacterium]